MDRSRFYDRDPITLAMLDAESNYNPYAVSSKGARGVAQIMPATAANPGFGLEPIDLDNSTPEEQAEWAERYRRATTDYLSKRLPQDPDMLGVAAYNAGPGAVLRAGGDISQLPQETQDYVPKVLGGASPERLASLVTPDLPPGKAAETNSKDALQELIGMQKQRMAGNADRDRHMMWLNFFQGLGGAHPSIGDALVSATGAAAKTVAEQQAQHEKIVDSSLENQIKLEQLQQEKGLREAQANYYNAGARGVRGGNSEGKWVATKDAGGRPVLFNTSTREIQPLAGDAENPAPRALSATEQKDFTKQQDLLDSASASLDALQRMKEYIGDPDAPEGSPERAGKPMYSGFGASTMASADTYPIIGGMFDDTKAANTRAYQNLALAGQYAKLQSTFPGAISNAEREAMEKLAALATYTPEQQRLIIKESESGLRKIEKLARERAKGIATGEQYKKAADYDDTPPTPKPDDAKNDATPTETKTLNGKTYTKINGKWHEQ